MADRWIGNRPGCWLAPFGAAFTETEQLALIIARQEAGVDNQAVRAVTGVHGADISKVLTRLRDRGFLVMVGSKRGAKYFLKAVSIVDNGSDLVGINFTLLHESQLRRIAEPVALRARLPGGVAADTIVLLCAVEPLSVQQLASLLGRTNNYVGQLVRALVEESRLTPLLAERRHPRQRYTATGC